MVGVTILTIMMYNPFALLCHEWEEFWYKYSDERIELARERLAVHRLNMEGKCQFNPYTEPDTDWHRYIP
jgi:hypothetical protein